MAAGDKPTATVDGAPAATSDSPAARVALAAGRKACSGRTAESVRTKYLRLSRRNLRTETGPANPRTVRLAEHPPKAMRRGKPAAGLAAALYATTRPSHASRDAFNGCMFELRRQAGRR